MSAPTTPAELRDYLESTRPTRKWRPGQLPQWLTDSAWGPGAVLVGPRADGDVPAWELLPPPGVRL